MILRDYSKIRIVETAWQNKTAWRLYQENWRIAHEVVELRDGYVCQIPGCNQTEHLQLDHVISRQCKIHFFDTDNLGYLCGPHHSHKSKRKGQWVDLMVKETCRRRVGDARFEDMILESRKTCGAFRTVTHQEQVNIKLKEQKAELLGGIL